MKRGAPHRWCHWLGHDTYVSPPGRTPDRPAVICARCGSTQVLKHEGHGMALTLVPTVYELPPQVCVWLTEEWE